MNTAAFTLISVIYVRCYTFSARLRLASPGVNMPRMDRKVMRLLGYIKVMT